MYFHRKRSTECNTAGEREELAPLHGVSRKDYAFRNTKS
jgi:hypothetical protein